MGDTAAARPAPGGFAWVADDSVRASFTAADQRRYGAFVGEPAA
jgi:hypothetical protein